MSRVSRLSIRALGGRLGGQWERDRRDTLFLMAAVLFSVLPHAGSLPTWIMGSFGMLFLWRLGLLFSGRPLPPDLLRWAAAIAIVFGVWSEYHTLIGRESGVALLVLFLGLKLMEMRARRDIFVVIFLCCFVLLTAYFESQGILMAAASMLAVALLVASMLTMQFRQEEIAVTKRLRFAAVLLLQSIPIAALLFVFFPRAGQPLWGAQGQGASRGSTGLSDMMSPGEIAQLAQSDAVVMRVEFDGAAPSPSRMYWRGPTLARFDGSAWRVIRTSGIQGPAPEVQYPRAGRAVDYAITLEPSGNRWLLALDLPVTMPSLPERLVRQMSTYELTSESFLTSRVRYTLQSRFDARAGIQEFARASPSWKSVWTEVPDNFNPRTQAFAQRLSGGEQDPRELSRRVLQLFNGAPFRYTLTPGTYGTNGIDEFLFDRHAGFCEHYSGAYVQLMRMMGVPARVVTGYLGAEAAPDGSYWIVRQSDAHAWAEIWIEGEGWVRVDPTGAIAPERIERGARLAMGAEAGATGAARGGRWWYSWSMNLDRLTHQWNQWVLSYDRDSQQNLLSSLGLDAGNWRQVAAVFAGLFALLIAGVALTTMRSRVPRHPIEREFDEFCQRMAEAGLDRRAHETPTRFLNRVDRLLSASEARQAREIVAAYNRMRYDEDTQSRADAMDLRRLVRAFRP